MEPARTCIGFTLFDILLTKRSITKAAHVLNLTHPALSKPLMWIRMDFRRSAVHQRDPAIHRDSLDIEPHRRTPKASGMVTRTSWRSSMRRCRSPLELNRPLPASEMSLARWMQEHGEPKAWEFLEQVAAAQVTPWRCPLVWKHQLPHQGTRTLPHRA